MQKLFASLTTLERKCCDEISRKQQEVECLQSALDVYRRYASELCENGTASDVATSSERLHTRACQLKKHDVLRQTKLLFGVPSVAFQQSTFGAKPPINLVGSIEERPSLKGLNHHSNISVLFSVYSWAYISFLFVRRIKGPSPQLSFLQKYG